MRIALTSDMHLPETPSEMIVAVANQIADYAPDLVVLAGDLGESSADTEKCLWLFRHIACPVLVLAGNHDLYPGRTSSRRLWEEVLPATVRHCGFHWLEGEPFLRDGIAVAGTIGWYDYSAADPSIRESTKVFAREKRYFIGDHRIDWHWTDQEFAAKVSRPFLDGLDQLEAEPGIKEILVVSHVPLLECQLLRKPGDRDWGFSNAYFGNLTLGREVLARSKVSTIVSGHTHLGKSARVQIPEGRTIQAHVIASDYRRPGWMTLTL